MAALPAAAAGDAAFRIFCTPSLSDKRGENYHALAERARFHLRAARRVLFPTPVGNVQGYVIEPATRRLGTILMVHGWSGEAAFMSVLAEPLRRAGFEVVLFDLPAHGRNHERTTNLIACAKATVAVSQQVGRLHAVVAHSFGGMVAMLAAEGHSPLRGVLRCQRFVLISCPNRLSHLTDDFSCQWGLSAVGRRAFEHRLERIGQRPLGTFVTAQMIERSEARNVLLVHSKDDADVSFQSAQELAAAHVCELSAFDGVGHNAILFAPPILRSIAKQLAASANASPAEKTTLKKGTGDRHVFHSAAGL